MGLFLSRVSNVRTAIVSSYLPLSSLVYSFVILAGNDMSKKAVLLIVAIECIAIVLGFLTGLIWYPHIHHCLLFTWNITGIGGSSGSKWICNP